jgi:hypothetical protein
LESDIILNALLLVSVDWDYDRFAESSDKKRAGKTYFADPNIGKIRKPAIIVDRHGKIMMWYLPGLLLPRQVVCSIAPVQNLSFLLTLWLGRHEQGYNVPKGYSVRRNSQS